MRHADLGKADVLRDRFQRILVLRVPVAMHQTDRNGPEALCKRSLQIGACGRLVQRRHDLTVRSNALFNFNHRLVQQLGQLNLADEQLGPCLICNAQLVTEPARHHEQRTLALALQQRIGGDRSAHLDRLDQLGRDRVAWLNTQQLAHALHGGILVALRVLGKQFVRLQRAVGSPRHDVGEGAAAIDPELPLTAGSAPTTVTCLHLLDAMK